MRAARDAAVANRDALRAQLQQLQQRQQGGTRRFKRVTGTRRKNARH
jgi:hypothetical protein